MPDTNLDRDRLAKLTRKDNNQKGPGDFSPKDPVECTQDCPYIQEDGSCSYIDTVPCYYAEDGGAYWEEMYLKGEKT